MLMVVIVIQDRHNSEVDQRTCTARPLKEGLTFEYRKLFDRLVIVRRPCLLGVISNSIPGSEALFVFLALF